MMWMWRRRRGARVFGGAPRRLPAVRLPAVLLLTLACLAAPIGGGVFAPTVAAASGGGALLGAAAGRGEALLIPVGQRTDTVVSWGRPVEIAGAVSDEVVVVSGDVTVRPTARVGGRIIVVGGRVNLDRGSRVSDGVFAVDLGTATLDGLLLGLLGFGAVEGLRLVAAAALVVVALLINLAFGYRLQDWLDRHPKALWRGTVAGFVTAVGVGGTAVLAVLTFWGLPLAALLLLVAAVATLFGLGMVSLHVGTVIAQAWRQGTDLPAWRRAVSGGTALALVTSFPVIGWVAAGVLMAAALGSTILFIVAPARRG